jgi:hypothetical protein
LVLLLATELIAGGPAPCSPEAFGPTAEDPLTIAGEWDLPAGCLLDFGDRRIVLEGVLRGSGLTISAGDLLVQTAARIEGGGGVTTLILGRDGDMAGLLVNNGSHGGGIVVEASGTFSIGGRLEASAIEPSGSGGFINVRADQAVVLGLGAEAVALAGAAAELGGEVAFLSARASVDLSGEIHVTGGSYSPGAVTITAGTTVRAAGRIGAGGSCGAVGECSLAGVVRMSCGGDLMLESDIDIAGAEGGVSSADGSGGHLTLDAGGDVSLAGFVNLSGAEPGRGGTFRARLDGEFLQARGATVDASGGSDGASGGTIQIDSAEGILLDGGLGADGGVDGDGGTIRVTSELDVHVAGKLSASGNYPTGGIEIVSRLDSIVVAGSLSAAGRGSFGTGGPIGLYSVTGIDLDAAVIDASGNGADGLGGAVRLDTFGPLHASPGTSILARGDPDDAGLGLGGSADLVACGIAIEQDGLVAATGGEGGGGAIHLTASDSMDVAAVVNAVDGGLIQVRHPGGMPPDFSGSAMTPDPMVSPAQTLVPCLALPGTTFSRGDCNTRDGVNITDPINLLNSLFLGTPARLPCEKACDANDDGLINISDPIKLLNALFVSQGEVLPPPLLCGLDETEDSLTCEEFAACP